ncbi:family 20 glycosylhydrolase [Isoptericola variabilis]|uniref:beta-N-acetylhexosaminidase n=1 Tax=Isoptericola variabilis (strain 225) TaxID=743718 RepID=F6FSS3_ISOV2|nr:family 20 glycosylhydrolase [Isoptericola variabilis]AEG45235.1 Glycoside hydrolase, family 20, catalytic core [Isoptericola variabilis 225]
MSLAVTDVPHRGPADPRPLPIVPWPVAVEPLDGPGPVLDAVRLDAPDPRLGALAAEQLAAAGVRVDDAAPVGVTLRLDAAAGPPGSRSDERYTLRVSADGVVAVAPERVGLLHAVRVLRQLVGTDGVAPAVVVHDAPRYRWRGLMVDVVRHFFGPADLRAVVDLAGALRLRVLAHEGTEVGISRLWFDNPATEPFLRDVIGDVARLTDGPYVHVGGDEVLTMDSDEYTRFVELACRVVREAGKTPVAWQEAAHARLEAGTLLQYWDPRVDAEPFVTAAAAGVRFVMSPGNRAYLDMKYTPEHPLGLQWAGFVELRDAYDWEPTEVVPELPADAVEGVSAAVWTETLATRDEVGLPPDAAGQLVVLALWA